MLVILVLPSFDICDTVLIKLVQLFLINCTYWEGVAGREDIFEWLRSGCDGDDDGDGKFERL
jgi:hypothetical protein